MLVKVLLSVLLLQATAMAEECSEEEIVTQKVTEVNQLLGNWSVVFAWNKDISLSSLSNMGKSLCIISSLSTVTPEEVEAKKADCKYSRVPFDYENVVVKISLPQLPSPARLVSFDGEKSHIQQNCYFVNEVEVRVVNDNYLLVSYPGSQVAELLSKTVPDREDLSCTVRNIDATKNKIGFPLCFK